MLRTINLQKGYLACCSHCNFCKECFCLASISNHCCIQIFGMVPKRRPDKSLIVFTMYPTTIEKLILQLPCYDIVSLNMSQLHVVLLPINGKNWSKTKKCVVRKENMLLSLTIANNNAISDLGYLDGIIGGNLLSVWSLKKSRYRVAKGVGYNGTHWLDTAIQLS